MIIVLGAFRSGTSLVSALLSELGVDFGPASSHYPAADRANPLGYFQLREVVNANRDILRSADVVLADPPSPEQVSSAAAPGLLDGFALPASRGGTPGIKDPRFSLTLDYWWRSGRIGRAACRLVVLDRSPPAVARSVVLHREVGAYVGHDPERAERMVRAMQAGAAWHAAHAGAAMTIAYEDIIARPDEAIARLADFAGTGTPEAQAQAQALRLIGKERAIRRHYRRKLLNPARLAETLAKSLGAQLAR